MRKRYECPLCGFIMTEKEVESIKYDFKCPKCNAKNISNFILKEYKEGKHECS